MEKPDAATAAAYVADPAYSWNAGMFMFKAGAFLEEAGALAPGLTGPALAAVAQAKREGETVRLSSAFLAAPSEAIDTAILEKTGRAGVIRADIGWRDVGDWNALYALTAKSAETNALDGPVIVVKSTGCLARSDGPAVVLAGVEDLVVVVENGAILVARRDDPAAVRAAVDAIRAAGRDDLL